MFRRQENLEVAQTIEELGPLVVGIDAAFNKEKFNVLSQYEIVPTCQAKTCEVTKDGILLTAGGYELSLWDVNQVNSGRAKLIESKTERRYMNGAIFGYDAENTVISFGNSIKLFSSHNLTLRGQLLVDRTVSACTANPFQTNLVGFSDNQESGIIDLNTTQVVCSSNTKFKMQANCFIDAGNTFIYGHHGETFRWDLREKQAESITFLRASPGRLQVERWENLVGNNRLNTIAANVGNRLHLLDIRNYSILHWRTFSSSKALRLALSPDGVGLISSMADCTVIVCNGENLDPWAHFVVGNPSTNTSSNSAAISHNFSHIYAAANSVKAWQIDCPLAVPLVSVKSARNI